MSAPDRKLPPPWIVGHRGAREDAPENSVAGFRLAVQQRATWVEADLQLTADGGLVACHDSDLSRLTGASTVVEETPLAELVRLRLGDSRDDPRIPTLDEVLASVPADVPLNLELKRRRASRVRLAEALAKKVANLDRPLVVSSFDWPLLTLLRGLLPALAVAPLGRFHPRRLLATAERLAAFSVHCHRRLATPALISAARADGRPVVVYTVNDASEAARLFALGVTGVFTDAPGRLRKELAS